MKGWSNLCDYDVLDDRIDSVEYIKTSDLDEINLKYIELTRDLCSKHERIDYCRDRSISLPVGYPRVIDTAHVWMHNIGYPWQSSS